jgi:hypothetical protein
VLLSFLCRAEFTKQVVVPALGVYGVGGALAVYGATDAIVNLIIQAVTCLLPSVTCLLPSVTCLLVKNFITCAGAYQYINITLKRKKLKELVESSAVILSFKYCLICFLMIRKQSDFDL